MPLHSSVTASRVVLDTNVVLDWLVFDDPSSRPWVQALKKGQLTWLATETMRMEWERVLTYKKVSSRTSSAGLLEAWQRHARICPLPPDCGLRCADPDDQVFIDLALAEQARWLLTKDKALLALKRRAWSLAGLRVVTPSEWAAGQLAEDAS